jgi:hypothetical protein
LRIISPPIKNPAVFASRQLFWVTHPLPDIRLRDFRPARGQQSGKGLRDQFACDASGQRHERQRGGLSMSGLSPVGIRNANRHGSSLIVISVDQRESVFRSSVLGGSDLHAGWFPINLTRVPFFPSIVLTGLGATALGAAALRRRTRRQAGGMQSRNNQTSVVAL